jgi:hypothetical protein
MYPVVSKPVARARAASDFISSANKRPFCARSRHQAVPGPSSGSIISERDGASRNPAQARLGDSAKRPLYSSDTLQTCRIIAASALPRLQTLQDRSHRRSPATTSFARWPRDAGLPCSSSRFFPAFEPLHRHQRRLLVLVSAFISTAFAVSRAPPDVCGSLRCAHAFLARKQPVSVACFPLNN